MCLFCKWFKKLCGSNCKCKCHAEKCCHGEKGSCSDKKDCCSKTDAPVAPNDNQNAKASNSDQTK